MTNPGKIQTNKRIPYNSNFSQCLIYKIGWIKILISYGESLGLSYLLPCKLHQGIRVHKVPVLPDKSFLHVGQDTRVHFR